MVWAWAAKLRELVLAVQQEPARFMTEDFTGELFSPDYLVREDKAGPVDKETRNGLEDPENRRSAGWHGNQHVCVRRPKVSGGDSLTF